MTVRLYGLRVSQTAATIGRKELGAVIGRAIAHYTITEKLGQGGMGEVYRARDTKLDREVALKILPEALTADPQHMARFQREARILAALDHPNIGAIHGIEEAVDCKALVLQLIEGPTLADRIAEGPLPVEEALEIGLQITHALEAAHEKGIIHRDLKPANVKTTPQGQVKVLDFGLAKAQQAEPMPEELSDSPTLTEQSTGAGVVLGTAAYMSPEQARGKGADARSDIWAFGATLFEMLTAYKPFEGQDASLILAAVLREEPNWGRLPKQTAFLRRVLARCLAKDPGQRYHHIADVRLAIEDAQDAARHTHPAVNGPHRQSRLAVGVAALMVLTLAILLWKQWQREPQPSSAPRPTRLTLQVPVELGETRGPAAVFSPDGRRIAYVTSEPALYLRRLDQPKGVRLAGTEGVISLFFAPDGQWIAFVADDRLKKVSVNGGSAISVGDVSWRGFGGSVPFRGGSWGEDGSIVYSMARDALYRVPAEGEAPEVLTTLEAGEFNHLWPDILPGAKACLMTVLPTNASLEEARIEAVTLADRRRKVLHRGGHSARYAPTGHLVFVHQETLFGAPFALDRLELLGQPVPILEDVAASQITGGQFSFSREGSLVYQASTNRQVSSPVWVDWEGNVTPWKGEAADYWDLRFSPDGIRLATTVSDGAQTDIWIEDLEKGSRSRLTFAQARDLYPVWTPDGQQIVFSSERDGPMNLYRKRADGTGETDRLTEKTGSPGVPTAQFSSSISFDGRFLAFFERVGNDFDLWTLALEGNAEPEPFLQTEFSETHPAFSPDGRWLAYASNESGREEVYVRPFPRGPGKTMISTGGGNFPFWSRSGEKLLYFWNGTMYAASYRNEGPIFEAQTATPLFSGTFISRVTGPFDLAPDGRRFVMLQAVGKGPSTVFLIQNWFEELKRLVPRQ